MFFQYFFFKKICNHKLKSIYIHLLNLWDFLILTFCFWLNLNCCDTSNYHKVTWLLPPPSMAGLYLFAGPFVFPFSSPAFVLLLPKSQPFFLLCIMEIYLHLSLFSQCVYVCILLHQLLTCNGLHKKLSQVAPN